MIYSGNLYANLTAAFIIKTNNYKDLGSIKGVYCPMSKISFTVPNYRSVIWDMNYMRYFVI